MTEQNSNSLHVDEQQTPFDPIMKTTPGIPTVGDTHCAHVPTVIGNSIGRSVPPQILSPGIKARSTGGDQIPGGMVSALGFPNYNDEIADIHPHSFDHLIELIHETLRRCSLKDLKVVEKLRQIMENYSSKPREWQQYAFFDKFRYTRNLVAADEDYKNKKDEDGNLIKGPQWNLLVLCWGPGHQSPIHDHSGSHCILKVLNGELRESRYEWPADMSTNDSRPLTGLSGIKMKTEEVRVLNQAAYMCDQLGLHRISNRSETEGAISLHLYWPPIDICRTFNEATGEARVSGKCVYYSTHGEKCNYEMAAGCPLNS